MASTIQIVPKYSYPGYIETVINDYTFQSDDAVSAVEENDVRQVYAVRSPKGIDNTWIRKSSRESAVRTFGESNHKKYGQPLMQALSVVDKENTSVWFMRVMPNAAAKANAFVNGYFLANEFNEDGTDAHLATFDVKFKVVNDTNIGTVSTLRTGTQYTKTLADGAVNAYQRLSGATEVIDEDGNTKYMDGDFTVLPFLSIASYGRGTYGNNYSMRITRNTPYEKDYGIKMYTFEVDSYEKGITVDAQYVGSLVTPVNYRDNATLINDVLDDSEKGLAPVEVKVDENSFMTIYDAYIAWATKWHDALGKELETIDSTETLYAQVKDLYNRTDPDELPDEDEFDIIMGYEVNSSTTIHPGYHVITANPYTNINDPIDVSFVSDEETGDVDYTVAYVENAAGDTVMITPDTATIYSATSASTAVDVLYFYNTTSEEYEEYDPSIYDDSCVNFPALKAMVLANGSEGEFADDYNASKRKTAITKAYANAFNGTYDPKIFSKNRMGITVMFDACYPYTAKQALYDLTVIRQSNRCFMDLELPNGNFMTNLSEISTLQSAYADFADRLVSKEIGSYETRDPGTNKKVRVSTTYFEATEFCDHLNGFNNGGFNIPFVNEYCELSGHIYDSLVPYIPDAGPLDVNGLDTVKELREKLDKYRLNFFETVSENVFRRATQNTSQVKYSDLVEENNVTILYTLKRNIERAAQGQTYNFADPETRQTFINTQNAIYQPWVGSILESFNIFFQTSAYEAKHSIMHVYLEVVFRGLTKVTLIEIDVNPRDYGDTLTALDTAQ